ncbi:hypothetical protein HAX54_005514, partial [Datura stramonium]|nr:hypothetical protein [Datura stramonium]
MKALELKLLEAEAIKEKLSQVEEEHTIFRNEYKSLSLELVELKKERTQYFETIE